MLESIAIGCIVIWLLGVVSGYTFGNFIFLFLVAAAVLFLVRCIVGPEQTPPPRAKVPITGAHPEEPCTHEPEALRVYHDRSQKAKFQYSYLLSCVCQCGKTWTLLDNK